MHTNPLDGESGPAPVDDPRALDERLIGALEAAPRCQAPADFAGRVLGRLPRRVPVTIPASRFIPATEYGRTAILIGLIVLLISMLDLAAHTSNAFTFRLALEWTLLAQFVALTVWFSTSRRGAD